MGTLAWLCSALHRTCMRVLILGASGYVGGELLRLLASHPELRASRLTGNAQAGEAVGAVHPHLALAYPEARIEAFDEAMLGEADLVVQVGHRIVAARHLCDTDFDNAVGGRWCAS